MVVLMLDLLFYELEDCDFRKKKKRGQISTFFNLTFWLTGWGRNWNFEWLQRVKLRLHQGRLSSNNWCQWGSSVSNIAVVFTQGAMLAGGGWSYIFRTLNSIPFFPDKSRYHRIFTLSGLFRTCQAPDSAAEVDPIAHFGHFRSHLATCTW